MLKCFLRCRGWRFSHHLQRRRRLRLSRWAPAVGLGRALRLVMLGTTTCPAPPILAFLVKACEKAHEPPLLQPLSVKSNLQGDLAFAVGCVVGLPPSPPPAASCFPGPVVGEAIEIAFTAGVARLVCLPRYATCSNSEREEPAGGPLLPARLV